MARCIALLPTMWRDALYDWVAAHRVQWFGRRRQCMVPTEATRQWFLDWE
ncbi:MAG: hypothetical protein K6T83_07275 [Alicyclobacillus sp.]|nr:hypothetical protein [Alicyclobacillus sp.]